MTTATIHHPGWCDIIPGTNKAKREFSEQWQFRICNFCFDQLKEKGLSVVGKESGIA